jgi:iron complex outermembrane recepter protein
MRFRDGQGVEKKLKVRALLLATAICSVPVAASAQTAPAGEPAAAEEVAQEQEIVLTGSRISRRDLDAPTPTKVLSAEALEVRGAASVGEFLAEVPSFRNTQGPQTNTAGTLGTGQFSADLRALGVIRTLTLVDGRRFVPSAATGQVDLNLIPQILVDRLDVVTGGASATYGSDAVSGVVNVLLNKRLEGIKGDFSMGISDRGDARETRAALAFGAPFADGRGHIVIGGEYVKSKGVNDPFGREAFAEQPGLVSYVGARPAGKPSRVYERGVSFINMAYGGLITGVNADLNAGNGADVLRGIQFGPNGAPTAFNYGNFADYGTGSTLASNFTGGNKGLYPQDGWTLIVPTTRRVAFGHIDYEATDGLNLFVEASYGRSGGYGNSPPVRDQGSAATILRDNAFLHSSIRDIMVANNITSFTLGRPYNDFGPITRANENSTERFVAGFDYDLGGSWKIDGYYQYGRNVLNANVANLRIESNFRFATDAVNVGGQIVCAATQANGTVTSTGQVLNRFNSAAAGCVPINLFGQGSPSKAAIDYVTGDVFYQVTTKQQVAALTMQGELFKLPGGPFAVAFGGEWRKEEASAISDALSQANGFNYSNPKPYAGGYDVKEVFAEAVAPILRDQPFAQHLELNGAIRYTDYSTSGGVTTWKVGGIYAPFADLRLRATRSRDIRAPNNAELFATTAGLAQLRNPWSGVTTQITTINQPSPTLKPEKADTWTVGGVFTPRFIPGLTVSVDYYDINIKGAISSFSSQSILDNCFAETGTPFFCNFVTRTGTGAGTVVDLVAVQLLNIAGVRTRGIDFAASYRTRIGESELTLRGMASYVKDLIFDDGTGAAPRFSNGVIQSLGGRIDRAGSVGGTAFTAGQQTSATNTPSWTATGSIAWALKPVNVSLQGRYIGGGKFDATLVGPGDQYYDPASPISIGNNRVDSRFYLDLAAQVDVIKDGNRKLQFYFNVNNLTDKAPPFPVTAIAGMYDRMGRYYRAGLRFSY